MNGIIMILGSGVLLLLAYLFYGRYLAKKWGIDEKRVTPAHEKNDGVDYIPAKPHVVFGHQFASIAGAGPINGPIIAAMFGWVPVLLWILIGGVFFGAVQDFASMYASVRNEGKSVGYIIELYIGKTGKKLFLLFVWLFSILVVAAFADIVAGTFNGFDAQGAQLIEGGSVAMTSVLFIVAAIALGFVFKKFNVNNIISIVLALVLLVVCVWLGMTFPLFLAKNVWLYLVFAYIFAASVTPVWALLQPRDYLNSFLLIAMMLMAFVGVLVANPAMELKAFTGFNVNGNYLFPILFVTVACGAVSGFHSLIASGTSSKQIDNEKHMLPISFGAMLVESFLAVISLVAVGALALGGTLPKGTPPVIFATAISGFLSKIGLSAELSYTLITLAVSAFALTSLDSVARVGRIAFGELFEGTILGNKFISTALTLIFGFALAVGGYQNVWPLFGSANQLLAALALIACAVFLKRTGRAAKMLYVPMIIMLIVTITALVISIVTILSKGSAMSFPADILQLIIGTLLLCLGVVVAVQGINKIRKGAEVQPVKN